MNRDTAPMTHVRRSFPIELRAEKRADGAAAALPLLVGHASVFNVLSEDLGGWKERCWPGAFDGILADDGIYSLWNHNPDFIIGAVADGSLRLSVDSIGLVSETDPMDTQLIRDLVVKPIQDGKVRKMSIAFDVATYDWTVEDGMDIREVRRFARLYDTSPVTYPAFPQTNINARSLAMLAGNFSEEQRAELVQLVTHADFKRSIATGSDPAPSSAAQKGEIDGGSARSAGAELMTYRARHHERIAGLALA